MPKSSTRQIEAILPFLETFEQSGFSAGSWNSELGEMPYFTFDGSVTDFEKTLYDNGWITSSFDWSDWQVEAARYIDSDEVVSTADVDTVRKLFTTHLRKERFCEGHLAAMFENGHILALLRRLKEIKNALGTTK